MFVAFRFILKMMDLRCIASIAPSSDKLVLNQLPEPAAEPGAA